MIALVWRPRDLAAIHPLTMPFVDAQVAFVNRVVNLLRAQCDPSPPQWWYLSFVDPAADEWLGGCYMDAPNAIMACARAHALGCNPGGEAQVTGPLSGSELDGHVPVADRHEEIGGFER